MCTYGTRHQRVVQFQYNATKVCDGVRVEVEWLLRGEGAWQYRGRGNIGRGNRGAAIRPLEH